MAELELELVLELELMPKLGPIPELEPTSVLVHNMSIEQLSILP